MFFDILSGRWQLHFSTYGLNVRKYLNHVLKELPKRMSKNIDDLLPINWKEPEDLK